MGATGPVWHPVGTTAQLRRSRSLVVDADSSGATEDIVVFWNGGEPTAMANLCVHRERELARSNIFQGKVICPGHQWAFDAVTGFCAERERTQPVYATRIVGDDVSVDVSGPSNAEQLASEA